MADYDFAIIGAGMAGASLATELAPHGKVLVAEAEDHPGYHATGRSAAFWTESYGGRQVQPLTSASGPWLANPPSDISPDSLLAPRGALTLATQDDSGALAAFAAQFTGSGVAMKRLEGEALRKWVPGLCDTYAQGILEPDCCDIDVGRLHACYLAALRRRGATLATRMKLGSARREGGQWSLDFGSQKLTARILVNAGGAWADEVARCAGVAAVGLQPFRRTVAQLRLDRDVPDTLPLVLDINGEFYFKPEGNRLWLSPHDETPSAPCDAAPEELDVALAIDRLGQVVDWKVENVERKWAGLRTFAPDRIPVIGFDPCDPGFFWFAGQGGFGIQTAPAAALLARSHLTGEPLDPMLDSVDPALYDPARFSPARCSNV